MTCGADVVAAARGWINTPYQHQQRTRGLACDCAGLVIGVARELDIVAPGFDVTGYVGAPDGVSLLAWCDRYMARVSREDMRPGHVVVMSFDVHPQHLGFVGDYRGGRLSLIHAAQIVGRVVEHRLMFHHGMTFRAAFAMPGVEY